jgi:hypothetical protein
VRSFGRQDSHALHDSGSGLHGLAAPDHGQGEILVEPHLRAHPQRNQNLVGYFLNTIVMRGTFTERLDFRSLLRQVRERRWAPTLIPTSLSVVAELAPERDQAGRRSFRSCSSCIIPKGVSDLEGVGNRRLETGTSKFDLTLFLSETEHGLDSDRIQHGFVRGGDDSADGPPCRNLWARSPRSDRSISRCRCLARLNASSWSTGTTRGRITPGEMHS